MLVVGLVQARKCWAYGGRNCNDRSVSLALSTRVPVPGEIDGRVNIEGKEEKKGKAVQQHGHTRPLVRSPPVPYFSKSSKS
jgi:hypothetical protein